MSAGGRPRNPEVTLRTIAAATTVIAVNGMASFTGEEVTAAAGIGKASLYRRWPHMTDLLVDIVAQLGIGDIDYGDDPFDSSTRDDAFRLLAEATTGPRALAEVAVLPVIGTDERLQRAYAAGPYARLLNAAAVFAERVRSRGEVWPVARDDAVLAGVALLQQRMATTGRQAQLPWIDDAVDFVVLPAMHGLAVAS